MSEEVETFAVRELRMNSWKSVPTQCGVYWWYFPETFVEEFGVFDHCTCARDEFESLPSGELLLYVGVAKSLRQRTAWHAEQRLTQSSLRSGFLSTFRLSLLALCDFPYATAESYINEVFDELRVRWRSCENRTEADEIERQVIGSNTPLPINLRDNHDPRTESFRTRLSQLRKTYKSEHRTEAADSTAIG